MRRRRRQKLSEPKLPRPRSSALNIQYSALYLVGAVIVTGLLAVAAARTSYLPGDLEVTRFLQSSLPADTTWAQLVSKAATVPWVYLLAGLAAILSLSIAGWRAAILALICFGGAVYAGPRLQDFIARPRPSPALVRVVVSSPGYSFPSISAFIYGSTIGFLAVLAAAKANRPERSLWILACALLLLVGGAARVALGAHWPSDVLISYLIVMVWASLLVRFA
jgi:membrane-associated phospholipid phosphatase